MQLTGTVQLNPELATRAHWVIIACVVPYLCLAVCVYRVDIAELLQRVVCFSYELRDVYGTHDAEEDEESSWANTVQGGDGSVSLLATRTHPGPSSGVPVGTAGIKSPLSDTASSNSDDSDDDRRKTASPLIEMSWSQSSKHLRQSSAASQLRHARGHRRTTHPLVVHSTNHLLFQHAMVVMGTVMIALVVFGLTAPPQARGWFDKALAGAVGQWRRLVLVPCYVVMFASLFSGYSTGLLPLRIFHRHVLFVGDWLQTKRTLQRLRAHAAKAAAAHEHSVNSATSAASHYEDEDSAPGLPRAVSMESSTSQTARVVFTPSDSELERLPAEDVEQIKVRCPSSPALTHSV